MHPNHKSIKKDLDRTRKQNPCEHISKKKAIAILKNPKKEQPNGNSDDKSKEKAPDDTFKQCAPVEEESIVDDDPVADSTEETPNATLSKTDKHSPYPNYNYN